MATINFFLQSKKDPAGIYVRLREGAKVDAKAKTKFAINHKDWSASKGQPKLKDEGAKNLNADLTKFRSELLDHYNKCVNKVPIDSYWLKSFIDPITDTEIPDRLIPYMEFYNNNQAGSIAVSSQRRNGTFINYVSRFQKEKKKNFYVADFNPDFKIKFEAFGKENGYRHNTTARTIKFIKTVCYDARLKGVMTHPLLDTIIVKLKNVDKIYLDFEELGKIENVRLEHDYLDNARDWLLISCETAQRVSDFLEFTKYNIRTEEGITLIEFTQKKTGRLMAVPLSKRIRKILKKRKGDFPRKISDVNYNLYIKQVCRIAGLTEKVKGDKMNPKTKRKESGVFPKWELVTSHIGRRSFATNYYGSIPTALLMNATGHKTERMFLEYIGKTNTDHAKQLAQYIK
jgi:integrase